MHKRGTAVGVLTVVQNLYFVSIRPFYIHLGVVSCCPWIPMFPKNEDAKVHVVWVTDTSMRA